MNSIKGIIAAMQTAMHEDGSINEEELRRDIDRQIDAGVNAVFCLGTNGEFYALSEAEKIKVMEIFVSQAAGRVPVYAGTGCVTTTETVRLSKKAEEIGVDVLSVISPYFAAISQEELFAHYKEVADAVSLPIVLYNIPMRTGVNIAPDTVLRLAKECKNIKGVKDSSGNFNNILGYIQKTADLDFAVLSGNDALILPTLLAGGNGGITAIANILPTVMVSIYANFLKGDIENAWKSQFAISDIRDCFKYGNPNSIVKYATNVIGCPVGPCRKPFGMLSEEAKKGIENCIKEHYSEYIGK